MAFKLTKKEAAYLQKLADAYESARDEFAQSLEDISSEWEEAFNAKSDKWKEGDAGYAAGERINTIRGWCDEFPDVFCGNIEDLL